MEQLPYSTLVPGEVGPCQLLVDLSMVTSRTHQKLKPPLDTTSSRRHWLLRDSSSGSSGPLVQVRLRIRKVKYLQSFSEHFSFSLLSDQPQYECYTYIVYGCWKNDMGMKIWLIDKEGIFPQSYFLQSPFILSASVAYFSVMVDFSILTSPK